MQFILRILLAVGVLLLGSTIAFLSSIVLAFVFSIFFFKFICQVFLALVLDRDYI